MNLYKINSNQDAIDSLSSPTHSLPVRSIGWRPDESSTESVTHPCSVLHYLSTRLLTTVSIPSSGPILYTTTIDGQFRLWGCMIDEPDFFSLWITLNINPSPTTSSPLSTKRFLPVSTAWVRTLQMDQVTESGYDASIGRAKGGTKDDFLTVLSDGSIHLTTVFVRPQSLNPPPS